MIEKTNLTVLKKEIEETLAETKDLKELIDKKNSLMDKLTKQIRNRYTYCIETKNHVYELVPLVDKSVLQDVLTIQDLETIELNYILFKIRDRVKHTGHHYGRTVRATPITNDTEALSVVLSILIENTDEYDLL